MCHEMRNPHGFKIRRYAACLIGINKYLAVLPEAKASENICAVELNEILLDIIPNSWSKQTYV